jgi:hypothetical protein
MLKEGGLGLRSVPDCLHEHLDERPQRDRERASGRATVEVRQTALLGDRVQALRRGGLADTPPNHRACAASEDALSGVS